MIADKVADEVAAGQAATPTPEVLVICVGNAYRRDDGVGLLVASLLEAEPRGELRVLRESGDGVALLESWRGASDVVLVDAACAGAGPGTVYRIDVPGQPLPPALAASAAAPVPAALFPCSTHAFGVAEAIDMGRALSILPSRLVIYAIEGADFESGTGISPEVEEAAHHVAESVLAYGCTRSLQSQKS